MVNACGRQGNQLSEVLGSVDVCNRQNPGRHRLSDQLQSILEQLPPRRPFGHSVFDRIGHAVGITGIQCRDQFACLQEILWRF